MDLMTLHIIETGKNVIFCGTLGVDKTNLAVSIGIEARKHRYYVYFYYYVSWIDITHQKGCYRKQTRIKPKIHMQI